MSVKDLIRDGKTDLLQELYDSVLVFADTSEDSKSIKDIDGAKDLMFSLINRCVSESRLSRLKQAHYALLHRKNKNALPMLKLLEGGKTTKNNSSQK